MDPNAVRQGFELQDSSSKILPIVQSENTQIYYKNDETAKRYRELSAFNITPQSTQDSSSNVDSFNHMAREKLVSNPNLPYYSNTNLSHSSRIQIDSSFPSSKVGSAACVVTQEGNQSISYNSVNLYDDSENHAQYVSHVAAGTGFKSFQNRLLETSSTNSSVFNLGPTRGHDLDGSLVTSYKLPLEISDTEHSHESTDVLAKGVTVHRSGLSIPMHYNAMLGNCINSTIAVDLPPFNVSSLLKDYGSQNLVPNVDPNVSECLVSSEKLVNATDRLMPIIYSNATKSPASLKKIDNYTENVTCHIGSGMASSLHSSEKIEYDTERLMPNYGSHLTKRLAVSEKIEYDKEAMSSSADSDVQYCQNVAEKIEYGPEDFMPIVHPDVGKGFHVNEKIEFGTHNSMPNVTSDKAKSFGLPGMLEYGTESPVGLHITKHPSSIGMERRGIILSNHSSRLTKDFVSCAKEKDNSSTLGHDIEESVRKGFNLTVKEGYCSEIPIPNAKDDVSDSVSKSSGQQSLPKSVDLELHKEFGDSNTSSKRLKLKIFRTDSGKISSTVFSSKFHSECKKQVNKENQAQSKEQDITLKPVVLNCRMDDGFKSITAKLPSEIKKGYQCEFCNRRCRTKLSLKKHLACHKKKSSKTSVLKLEYTCTTCNSNFQSRRELKMHILSHIEEQSATFKKLTDQNEPEKYQRQGFARSCPHCSYSTNRRNMLYKHMKSHTKVKQYTCQQCSFASKSNQILLKHVKNAHSGASIYQCTACPYKFNALDSFKVHVALHAATKSEACLICGIVIYRRSNLIEHLMSHFCDEDVSCHVCHKQFKENHLYLMHLLKHSENGPTLGSIKGRKSKPSEYDIIIKDELEQDIEYLNTRVGNIKARNKLMNEVDIESNVSKLICITEKLLVLTRSLSFTAEKRKTANHLADISDFSTRLTAISRRMVHSYKLIHGISGRGENQVLKSENSKTDIFIEDSKIEVEDSNTNDTEENEPSVTDTSLEAKDDVGNNEEDEAFNVQISFGVHSNSENVATDKNCVKKSTHVEETKFTTKSKPLKCRRCDLIFSDLRGLKRHIQAHDDVRPHSCEECGQGFRRREHLKKHMVTHSEERPFRCTQCPYAAKSQHRLKIHQNSHSENKSFSCYTCSYSAKTRYELNHHQKRHERRECVQCGFVCYSRVEHKRHVFTHSKFDCSECDFTTNERLAYSKHMKKHQSTECFCCEICGYSCDSMKKFKYHKLRHENKTPFQCADCDYKCSSRASYDCHRLKHAGLKPYLCSDCGSSFRKSSHLNQHMLTHKTEKDFKCSQCGYQCRTKHNLREHEMTHTGEKPFACLFCSFACRRKKLLVMHMEKHMPMPNVPVTNMPMMMMPSLDSKIEL